jgi:peptidylprolyl isomerase
MRRRSLMTRTMAGGLAIAGLQSTGVIGKLMSEAEAAPTLDPQNTVYLDLKDGRVVIQLLPDLAPKAVERVKALMKQGFYDGTPFHRVIDGFMAQGGDPTGTGTGGSKLGNVPGEFTTKKHFLRGTVGAARTSDPNSADSQFFIMFAPAPSLDGQYTIWGQVVSGMEYIDKIKRGSGQSGMVQGPDKIIHMRLAADVKN